MPRGKATVRARALGTELKELRDGTGLSTRAVGARLGWSASTLSRIETGQRAVTTEDVSALLVLYDVTGTKRDRLLALARDLGKPGWWEASNLELPAQLPTLISFETQATHITEVGTVLVPGLLQTPEYARAVMVCTETEPSDIETLVATRIGRQVVLTRPDPPELCAIVDEAVLRRPMGGRAVMAEQIHHLVRAAQRPNVEVLVIPFDHGGHTGLDGPYVVLEFAEARTVVHLEHKRSCLFVDDSDEVAAFTGATDTLRKVALEPAASIRFLEAVASEYES